MFKFLLVLTLVTCLALTNRTKRRYYGIGEVKGLRNLLEGLSNNIYATCEMALFTSPQNYEGADKECSKFSIGKSRKSNLVTLDSRTKTANLMLLYDVAVKEADRPTGAFETGNWIWTGLQKVENTQVKGKNKKEAKNYKAGEWKWIGTNSSPTEYSNWPRGKGKQPDQRYLKSTNGCKRIGGCYQNQMRVDSEGFWDDGWAFEEHLFACDYNGKYILSNRYLPWDAARVACEKAGLQLAMVKNRQDVKEMKQAIKYFLGPAAKGLRTFDPQNWVWLGGNDLKREGEFRWLNGKLVNNGKWNVPWRTKAGEDNASFLRGSDGQNSVAFSRWGEFDDSFHSNKRRRRPFACQCPRS